MLDLAPTVGPRPSARRTTAWGLLLLAACAGQDSDPATRHVPAPTALSGFDPTLVVLIDDALRAVRRAPADPHTWRDLGQLYEAHLMLEWALPAYSAAVELDPSDARVQYRLAMTRIHHGDLHGGLKSLDEVHRLEPDYGPAWCKRGTGLLDLGRGGEARTAFERALAIDPANSAGTIGLAQVALQEGRPERALERLQSEALMDGPNAPLAHRLRGKALFQLGREEEAQGEIARGQGARLMLNDPWSRKLAAFKKGTSALLLRATRLMDRGKTAKAVELLEELFQREPDNPRVARKLGVAQASLGHWKQAVTALSLAVWLEPADAELKVSLAWAEIMSGNNEAALKTALAALEQDAGDAAAHEARLTALSNLGRFAELIEAYDGARTAGLEGASLELAAGKAQLELGAADRALAHFERAGKMDPEDAEAQVGCALAQIGLGSKDKAQACLERVRALAPDHPALAEVQAGIESLEDDAPRQDPAP
jgi:tetratricopeptide (TPR) repeat protein